MPFRELHARPITKKVAQVLMAREILYRIWNMTRKHRRAVIDHRAAMIL